MPKVKDIEYIVDEKGRKKRVILTYKAFMELVEDYSDLRVKAQREHETPEDFDKVLEELKNDGRL